MQTDIFRPFDTNLDMESALSIVQQATNGADDGELFLERRRSEALVLDDGRIKTASYDASEGFGLRAVRGETTGYAHSTTISESSLKRAGTNRHAGDWCGGGVLADGQSQPTDIYIATSIRSLRRRSLRKSTC